MNINRTNYENFFLLYVDGELSTSEMLAVDRFATENGDLQMELDILLDTKLNSDNSFHFANKNLLYRSAANTINEFNFEEQFLLYIDNELSAEEKEQTIHFVATHPEHNANLDLLKQTRLPIENIHFKNKELLYRKEEKRKPFVIGWTRMAVAAAMIGIMFLAWQFLLNTSPINEFAKGRSIPAIVNKQSSINSPSTSGNRSDETIAAAYQTKDKTITDASNQTKLITTPSLENESLAMNEAPKKIIDSEINSESMLNKDIETNNNSKDLFLSNSDHANQFANTEKQNENNSEQPVFQQAIYKELDTEDENKSLYVGSLELNKDKLRGIFRKASSIFKSKIKPEDDKYESTVTTRTLK